MRHTLMFKVVLILFIFSSVCFAKNGFPNLDDERYTNNIYTNKPDLYVDKVSTATYAVLATTASKIMPQQYYYFDPTKQTFLHWISNSTVEMYIANNFAVAWTILDIISENQLLYLGYPIYYLGLPIYYVH